MGAQQILNKIKNPDVVLYIGNERVVVGENKPEIKKGNSFSEIANELKEASKEDLFPINNNVCY